VPIVYTPGRPVRRADREPLQAARVPGMLGPDDVFAEVRAMTRLLPASWAPPLQSLLRIVAAFLFLTHGTQKLFGVPAAEPRPPVELLSLMGVAGLLETVGGVLLLVGLFTGPVALVLAAEMVAAYVMAHVPRGAWPLLNGGELALLYACAWLFFSAAGPGPWSLDTLWRQPSAERPRAGRLAA
jgi:putative oxidoreductase